MPRLDRDSVRRVVEQIDIVDLISKFVLLKIKGHEASGLCPFHNEKSPSFTVSRTKSFFYCFGCHAKGNVIDFVMLNQRLSFFDAVVYLSELYSIRLDYENNLSMPVVDKNLYNLMKDVSLTYYNSLKKNNAVIEYCKKRGISGESAKNFLIGYSSKNILRDIHDKISVKERELLSLWLNKPFYAERFHDRLIFPIFDLQSRVIGFGGRSLGNIEPKYLNSPETVLFHKGKVLFGMSQALKHPVNKWIIVEGYIDVVICHQYGITEAVGSLGTAFSLDHFKILSKYSSTLVFCFDNDQAGLRALDRIMLILIEVVTDVHNIKVLQLKDAKDPDEFLRKFGVDAWNKALDSCLKWEDYWHKKWSDGLDLNNIADRAKYLLRAEKSFTLMPNGYFKQLWISRLQKEYGTEMKLPVVKKHDPDYALDDKIMVDFFRHIIADPKLIDDFINKVNAQPCPDFLKNLLEWLNVLPREISTHEILEFSRNQVFFDMLNKAMVPSDLPIIPWDDIIRWKQKLLLNNMINLTILNINKTKQDNLRLQKMLHMKNTLISGCIIDFKELL